MMNTLKKNFQTYMIRPIIYQSFTKVIIGFMICLLWNRFINVDHMRNIYEHAFVTMAIIFAIMAWFQYLHMDGMKIHHLFETRKKKKTNHHWQRDIIDYADEKIISFEQLEENEKTVCRFLSNLMGMLIFLIPCLIHIIF